MNAYDADAHDTSEPQRGRILSGRFGAAMSRPACWLEPATASIAKTLAATIADTSGVRGPAKDTPPRR